MLGLYSEDPRPYFKTGLPGDRRSVARTNDQWFVTAVGEKKISTQSMIVDPSFLSMFSFPMLQGNPRTALANVNSIVLTEEMAKKMFGSVDVMNKVIRIDKNNFTVTGILEDLPTNTRFAFEYLLPWSYLKQIGQDDNYWGNNTAATYIQLKPNVSEAAAGAKMIHVIREHSSGEERSQEIFLNPIAKWHLYSNFENGKISGGLINVVRTFAIIAALILLIACINFMNLSTARSEKRAKEVGIRKVSGAHKGLLIGQFLGESVLIALISGAVALLLVQVFISPFDDLVGKELIVPYHSFYFWAIALLFILVTGLVAGSYPAFILSSFRPVDVLKGSFRKAHSFINPRKILVVLQFTFATVLIICTFIVVQQIRYAQNREKGYDSGSAPLSLDDGHNAGQIPALMKAGIARVGGRHIGYGDKFSAILENFSDSLGLSMGKARMRMTGRDFNRSSRR